VLECCSRSESGSNDLVQATEGASAPIAEILELKFCCRSDLESEDVVVADYSVSICFTFNQRQDKAEFKLSGRFKGSTSALAVTRHYPRHGLVTAFHKSFLAPNSNHSRLARNTDREGRA
jgi:hypothetical protein